MPPRPLVLIHGYSDKGTTFDALRNALVKQKVPIETINICSYVSLNNEITIKDLGEGLDRAFRLDPRLNKNADFAQCSFDAIVHSTGMLVLRAWLTNCGGATRADNPRLKRLKHLIGIAPATWGSPQAHKGRTWLGALVKGNRDIGPDFLNAGNLVLDGLELGSRFTWELAHQDLLADPPYYGKGANTPYVSVFIGNTPYSGLSSVANEPGTDGTVRWSGCGLNTRKITVDLTRLPVNPDGTQATRRLSISKWADDRLSVPIIPVDGRTHASIIANPDPQMVQQIANFLRVETADEYARWLDGTKPMRDTGLPKMLVNPGAGLSKLADIEGGKEVLEKVEHWFGKHTDGPLDGWQQFVVRAVDERGDGVSDYLIDVLHQVPGPDGVMEEKPMEQMYTDVHAYRADPSLRCIHLRLPQGVTSPAARLKVRINASTGTKLLGYQGYTEIPAEKHGVQLAASGTQGQDGQSLTTDTDPVVLDLSNLGQPGDTMFHPFTTTLIEIKLSREPLPLQQLSDLLSFISIPPDQPQSEGKQDA